MLALGPNGELKRPAVETRATCNRPVGWRGQVVLSLWVTCLLARPLALLAISGYQYFVSPHKGWCCAHAALHGGESCSAYAKRAIAERGVLSGAALLLARLDACREAAVILRAGPGPGDCNQACEKACKDGCEKGCRQPCDVAWTNFWAELKKEAEDEAEKLAEEAEKVPRKGKEVVERLTPPETPRPDVDQKTKEQTGDLLRVKEGQFTFDHEGNDNPKSRWFSRVIHWPGTENSGVTIGRGYDMGERRYEDVIGDLKKAGIPTETAEAIAKAAGMKGVNAEKFCDDNREEIGEITHEQQKALFELVFQRYVEIARDGVDNAKTVHVKTADGKIVVETLQDELRRKFDGLPRQVRDVACDLAYQLGGSFKTQNWGAIFQMPTFSLAADYMEGKLHGDVFDAAGNKLSYRAEDAVKRFRESRKDRFAGLVKKLRDAHHAEVLALSAGITRKIQLLPAFPDYLHGTSTGFGGGVADAWIQMFGKKSISEYDRWHGVAVEYRHLAELNLIRARRFAKTGDLVQGRRYLAESDKNLRLFHLANETAIAWHMHGVEKGALAAKAVYEVSRAAFVFGTGAAALGPSASVVADHIFTATDFAMNSSEVGVSEAAKRLVIDLVAQRIGKEMMNGRTEIRGADVKARLSDVFGKVSRDAEFSEQISLAIFKKTGEHLGEHVFSEIMSKITSDVLGISGTQYLSPQGRAP